ncbi:probable salivary secreted peptide [Fopius arisanus]|uniref:Probable salivary secreted peptide n=1 Tax=Fopius arisanus TaxID=64838 RepID=A0A9R1U5Z2_9HYME|nr:PREDICTED: probable salivary secreted peptide [Fopius arisanus]
MYSKCAFLWALVVAIAITTYSPSHAYRYNYATNSTNKSHNLIVGSRLPGDRITYQENIVKSSKLWQITTVEKTFYAAKNERITQVYALDQKTNGNGAYARITKGGPGLNNVTIKFKSQRNHGINFLVQIYSRP